MLTYAVYLKPKTSFASPIGSDTLFGALFWAVRALSGIGELEAMLKRFAGMTAADASPPFAVSNAFPFLYYEGAKVRLYPRPLIPELTSKEVESLEEREKHQRSALRPFQRATVAIVQKAKRVKDTIYVSEELLTQIARGEMDTRRLCERLVERGSADDDVVRWGKALITHGERKRVKAEELDAFEAQGDMQRNEIERVALATIEGRLFFTHETFLHREWAGLWFALRTNDLDALKPLLRYLADTGIGGDRSVGKGAFDIPLDEIHELELPCADEPNCFVILSRYIPADGECDFNQEPLAYAVTTIRPKHEARFAGTGHRPYKRLLRVFEPGSFFPFRQRKYVYGQVVNVGSTADVGGFEAYHSGLAVPVFAKLGGTT
jgi:CRISPR-associated protein Csm4